MKTCLPTLLFLFLCLMARGADPAGSWKGFIEVPVGKLAISVTLEEKDEWTGTISIPSQGLRAYTLSGVAVEGKRVQFAMKGVPGDPVFDGILADSGDSIAGSFKQGEKDLTFSLTRPADQPGPTLEQRLERLSDQLEQRRADQHIPGMAIAVVKDGAVIFSHGFGLANIEKKTPVTPDTLFAIGSTTKAFTATAIGMLVDDKKMSWDDSLTRHLPKVRFRIDSKDADAEATIRDLLSHRTGFARMGVTWAAAGLTRDEILATAAKAEPWSRYRQKFNYCNVTYLAAGHAAATVAKTDWDTLIAERILKPLGMTNSYTSFEKARTDPRFSLGYRAEKDSAPLPMRNVEPIGPAGAINSNVVDMAKWVRFQLDGSAFEGKRLISEEQLMETHRAQIEIGGGLSYGLGWMLRSVGGRRLVEHGGNIDGFAAQVGLFPDDKLGYVLLTNVSAAPLQGQVSQVVMNAILGEWSDRGENGPRDRKEFEPYLGTYLANFANFQDTEFTVQVKNGALAVKIPGQTTFELIPPDEEGKWQFALTDAVAISFDRDENGAVVGMKMYQGGLVFEIPRKGIAREAEVELEDVAKYLGSYKFSDKLTFKILIGNGRLAIEVPGSAPADLHLPDEEGRWRLRAQKSRSMKFNLGKDGKVKSMTLQQEGEPPKVLPRLADNDPDKAPDPPRVEEVLALRDVEGRGAAFDGIKSLRITGRMKFVNAGVEGTSAILTLGPDRSRFEMDLARHGREHRILNAGRGWVDSVFRPSEEMKGKVLAQAGLSSPPVIFGDWRKHFDDISVLRSEEFRDRPAHVIRLQAGDLPPLTAWIDAKDGSLLKSEMDVLLPTMNARIPTTTLYADHRKIHGIRLPWKSTTRNEATGSVVTRFEKLEVDLDLDEALFRIPSN